MTCANAKSVVFCYEIVVEDRVCVWFSKNSVGSVVWGGGQESDHL